MPRESIVLQLDNKSYPGAPEGVEIHVNGTWKSPAGGWLPVQQGTWSRDNTALYLFGVGFSPLNPVCSLIGLNFYTTVVGQLGTAIYNSLGDDGIWTTRATSDSNVTAAGSDAQS